MPERVRDYLFVLYFIYNILINNPKAHLDFIQAVAKKDVDLMTRRIWPAIVWYPDPAVACQYAYFLGNFI